MLQPNYYLKYLDSISVNESEDDKSFLFFLDNLIYEDWNTLLLDIFLNSPFPKLIQNERKDYSTAAYFSIFINKLSIDTKKSIEEILNQFASENLSLAEKGSSELFLNIFQLCRELEWGLSSELIIKKIILNQKFATAIKYDAAILLCFYKNDKEVVDFWVNESQEALQFYPFLSFPRFFFLSEGDPVNAFSSLEYFEKAEYIDEQELKIPLEDFFTSIKQKSELIEKIKPYYWRLNSWIKDFIEKNIFEKNDAEMFQENTLENFSIKVSEKLFTAQADNNIEFENIKNFIKQRILSDLVFVNLDLRSNLNKVFFKNYYSQSNYRYLGNYDNKFINKDLNIMGLVGDGKTFYNKSEFRRAMSSYYQCMGTFYKKRAVENLDVYFYSEILHNVGNVHFASCNFKKARELYSESYSVKSNLKHVPQVALFETQLKILGIQSYFSNSQDNWDQHLNIYISNVRNYFQEEPDANYHEQSSLLSDAYYFLSNGYAIKGMSNNFFESSSECLKISTSTNDFIGVLRINVLQYIYSKQPRLLNIISKILSSMTIEQKRHPSITTLIRNICQSSNNDNESINEIEDLFLKNEVPLQIPFLTE